MVRGTARDLEGVRVMDDGVRDLGSLVPDGRLDGVAREPIPPSIPARAGGTAAAPGTASATPGAARAPTPFGALPPGVLEDADALGLEGTLGRLAELLAHRGTGAGLCVGLLGGPGTGKSFALDRLNARIRALSDAAAGAGRGPFLSRVHVQPIDGASLEGDPVAALAAKLHAGLRRPYPDFAREAGHAARDPHVVLREVNDKLDEVRRRLDSERRALDDAGSRRARLVETVLYEAAGSQVDAYARANRAGIENRLTAFGINGDPLRNYKDLVRLVSGPGSRVGLALRSLWAFKGQTKLIVAAVVLVAAGVGLGVAIDDPSRWLDGLRSGPEAGARVATWFADHGDWLATARTLAFAGAALAIVVNGLRAFTFLQPVFKGERLLRADLDGRRRDLDGLYAYQTKRVDTLDADVERLTREGAEAERRVGGKGSEAPSPFQPDAAAQAQGFFALLGAMMADGGREAGAGRANGTAGDGGGVPQRIVLAIDHLDAVAPERARAILDALHRSLGAGLAAVVAADPARLATAPGGVGGDATMDDLRRWIAVPVRVDGGAAGRDHRSLVQAALGIARPATTVRRKPDASTSVLDEPVTVAEASMLTGLAGLAGPSPRAVKRFVDLYTLLRADARPGGQGRDGVGQDGVGQDGVGQDGVGQDGTVEHEGHGGRGALALMLALAAGGTEAEKASVAAALRGGDGARDEGASSFDLAQASPRLRAGLEAARALDGGITVAAATAAMRRAAMFAIR